MSLVEIRACPCPGFLQMNAETPPVPGSPEPPSSERSRAGGRKDCRELRSQESKGGDRHRRTRDLKTQRDSDSEPHGSWSSVRGRASPWTLPKAGNEFVSFSARSGSDLHGPPSEIAGQSCLRFHVHIYRQTFPWGEETKQSMSEGQGATNTDG